jgi:uncharacterized protein YndB with AHSA1/START domain
MNAKNDSPALAEPELLITHVFNAPRALVFEAWTKPEHMARWAGPHGFTASDGVMDVRPGGRHRACLHAPDGTLHWVSGVYREVVAPERLVFTHAWDDDSGKPGPETLITITFTEQGGKTLMTFKQTGFTSVASRDGHADGWSQAFQRLETLLAKIGE